MGGASPKHDDVSPSGMVADSDSSDDLGDPRGDHRTLTEWEPPILAHASEFQMEEMYRHPLEFAAPKNLVVLRYKASKLG